MSYQRNETRDLLKSLELISERKKIHREINKKRDEMSKALSSTKIGNKFSSGNANKSEEANVLVGLASLDDVKKNLKKVAEDQERRLISKTLGLKKPAKNNIEEEQNEEINAANNNDSRKRKNKNVNICLELEEDDDDDEEEEIILKRGQKKNPTADTSFLPDKKRDEQEKIEREKIVQEWLELNKQIKSETVELPFFYWDGTGHRNSCRVSKGSTIEQFLVKCLHELRPRFLDLKHQSVKNLMFIKEDLIIPHHYTFYDFIVNQYTNNNKLIFDMDAKSNQLDDEKIDIGKVCLRSWYERNKHIFPANKWLPFNPDF